MSDASNVIRLGTRGSFLARTQSQLIADELMARTPQLRVELRIIKTSGDRITDRPLYEEGGKGLFTKELELALLAGEIDFAVHSFKDVPVTMPLVEQSDLIIAAVPKREDPSDVAVLRDPGKGLQIKNARVGTSSLRRRCQILEKMPDAQIHPLRGNIDTRVRKLRDGEYDLIVLAAAGLKRAGLFDPNSMQPLDFLPAAGQGALALQCRKTDEATQTILQTLNDPTTAICVKSERALVWHLQGDCHSPIAALATVERNNGRARIHLRATVAGRGGNLPMLRAGSKCDFGADEDDADRIAKDVYRQLADLNVMQLLHGPTKM